MRCYSVFKILRMKADCPVLKIHTLLLFCWHYKGFNVPGSKFKLMLIDIGMANQELLPLDLSRTDLPLALQP